MRLKTTSPKKNKKAIDKSYCICYNKDTNKEEQRVESQGN